jgi:group II intron reverse transcriptase/maturase
MNVSEMQRSLSLKAEQTSHHRFDDLFSLVCQMDWLRLAHDNVARNAGSKTAGCDGIDMDTFDRDLEGNLDRLRESLQSDTFVACPVRRVYIPKPNGTVRPLGIPTIRDRIVQEALRMVLEPVYEADFRQSSFGFRPTRCTMDAIKCILWYTLERRKCFWVIEGDISAYFDTINHRKLMKLLRHRIKDRQLLDLTWKFLRAGVMERRLFKDTRLGTPQGGIVSPLLANVYLHELDKYMECYTALSTTEKTARRKQGLANFAYVRYADDFVVLCNGGKAQAEAMREELRNFLSSHLRLTLSMEKTQVTHLNDGFDFLGFHLRRSMGSVGMATKVLISTKGKQRHLDYLRAAMSSRTHKESAVTKILAINRVIAGWCRYYQYTSQATSDFFKIERLAFHLVANWLARKHKLSMPETLRRFYSEGKLGNDALSLLKHGSFSSKRYTKLFYKPNPYTAVQELTREELPDEHFWTGTEPPGRKGDADYRRMVIERDEFRCQMCGRTVTFSTAQVDHKEPLHRYKPGRKTRPEDLWSLCFLCHKRKTESDRQRESPVQ